MKLITLLALTLLFTSCGKGEVLNNIDREVSKVITTANDIKNEIFKNSGSFTEGIGDLIEGLGRIPREFAKAALGNSDKESESDRNAIKDNINDIQEQLDSLNLRLDEGLDSVSTSLSDLDDKIERGDIENSKEVQDLRRVVNRYYVELLRRIVLSDRVDRRSIRHLLSHLFYLQRAINMVNNRVSNLTSIINDLRDNRGDEDDDDDDEDDDD